MSHKRGTMHSIFKICISRNMKCDKTVGFLKYSHISGIVLITHVQQPIKPCVRAQYAECGRVCAISDNCVISSIQSVTLLETYSSAKAQEPRAVPRCFWLCTVTAILVLAKSDSACGRYSGLTIRKVFKEFGKYPKAGPAETKWCHQSSSLETGPTAVVSSANHT